jgi:hypothetical protein
MRTCAGACRRSPAARAWAWRSTASPAGSGEVTRSLAPGGEMIVYGALLTHRRTEPDRLTIPLDASSMIRGTKTVPASGSTAGSQLHPSSRRRGPGRDLQTRRRRGDPDPRTAARAPIAVRRRRPPGRSARPRRQVAAPNRRLTCTPTPPPSRPRLAITQSASTPALRANGAVSAKAALATAGTSPGVSSAFLSPWPAPVSH